MLKMNSSEVIDTDDFTCEDEDVSEHYTKIGHSLVEKGGMKEALSAFQTAYKLAVQTDNVETERACAFNLGAVLIALKDPVKGLDYLYQALPSDEELQLPDEFGNGDLFFNFALAHETLEDFEEALRHYSMALASYRLLDSVNENPFMEGEVCIKQGMMYSKLLKPIEAAERFKEAAAAYFRVNACRRQATALLYQANQLLGGDKHKECNTVLEECVCVCEKLPHTKELGKLFNEVGLTFMLCKQYYRAATCFECALPIIRSCQLTNKKHEAVILQNLGAAYNSLNEYQRSISVHDAAAALHAELGNRGSQGQSFCNLAYAYAKLCKFEEAGEAYLHALQAFKDIGDKHSQWQAYEGLGSVNLHQNRPGKAAQFFKMALNIISTAEHNTTAQSRIVGKLTDALQCQLQQNLSMQMQGARGFTPMYLHRGYESDVGLSRTWNTHGPYAARQLARSTTAAGGGAAVPLPPLLNPRSMSDGQINGQAQSVQMHAQRYQAKTNDGVKGERSNVGQDTPAYRNMKPKAKKSTPDPKTAKTNGDLKPRLSTASSEESIRSSLLDPTPQHSLVMQDGPLEDRRNLGMYQSQSFPKGLELGPDTLMSLSRGIRDAEMYQSHVAMQDTLNAMRTAQATSNRKKRSKSSSKVCCVM
ncbi:PREDICTED: tetratricopeptide repeat protein 24-like [Priapulus caudatus]|uniref:Tetratricopeptide repeat protein 24-like n=1 Tax=Priapulus caudatus TaxID=37621 RepID=A0ABM1DPK1_PRICU|nr:PREDICTED: tetratricopeptide repeat protein 24-like [Priapulus caudatus]